MIEENEIKKIKEVVEELLRNMTITSFNIEAVLNNNLQGNGITEAFKDFIEVELTMDDPQMLIGQNGQTLFELQRLLKIVLHKKLQKDFYLALDINGYKKKKIEYLKALARDAANEVSLAKNKKILPPMPAYERRIIHAELTGRQDVVTESQGEGEVRSVAISPR